MTAFTLLAVSAQIARNWLMLHTVGVNVSVFGAMAVVIAMITLGQIPIGLSIGPAAAVLVLGNHAVAGTAAASALLAVAGTAGSLCYAAWAITDRIVAGRLRVSPDVVEAPVTVTPTSARPEKLLQCLQLLAIDESKDHVVRQCPHLGLGVARMSGRLAAVKRCRDAGDDYA